MPGISPARAQLTCFIDDVLISFIKLGQTQPPNHKGPKIPNKQAVYIITYIYITQASHTLYTLSTILTISWKQSLHPFCCYLSEWLRHPCYIRFLTKLGSSSKISAKNQNTNVFKNHKTVSQSYIYIMHGVKGKNLTNCTELREFGCLSILSDENKYPQPSVEIVKTEALQVGPIKIKEQQEGT